MTNSLKVGAIFENFEFYEWKKNNLIPGEAEPFPMFNANFRYLWKDIFLSALVVLSTDNTEIVRENHYEVSTFLENQIPKMLEGKETTDQINQVLSANINSHISATIIVDNIKEHIDPLPKFTPGFIEMHNGESWAKIPKELTNNE